jgi:hypothetical protein
MDEVNIAGDARFIYFQCNIDYNYRGFPQSLLENTVRTATTTSFQILIYGSFTIIIQTSL